MAGKCANRRYDLSLGIRDARTLKPVSGASVILFAADDHGAWGMDYNSSPPGGHPTDELGHLGGSFFFNTYSGPGFIISDRCNRRLKQITMIVSAVGYEASRFTFAVKKLQAVKHERYVELIFPPIEIQPLR
jgi:hypothetical protein